MQWIDLPDGGAMTPDRSFVIERLMPNGLFRLFRYRSGLASISDTLDEAKEAAKHPYGWAPNLRSNSTDG